MTVAASRRQRDLDEALAMLKLTATLCGAVHDKLAVSWRRTDTDWVWLLGEITDLLRLRANTNASLLDTLPPRAAR